MDVQQKERRTDQAYRKVCKDFCNRATGYSIGDLEIGV
jgi:hypothetical protein